MLNPQYIHISLERWNFIVSLHFRKRNGELWFFCAGSILTRNIGEKLLLVLTDTEQSSQIIILWLCFTLQIYTVELQWKKWLMRHASGSFHFLFFVFWSKWPKTKKSAVLFVYFLYKKSTFCLKMTADFGNFDDKTDEKRKMKWNKQ